MKILTNDESMKKLKRQSKELEVIKVDTMENKDD
jgi:hypothetical protein